MGQGSVGKTSLVKRLLSNMFDPQEDSTHGIARHRWNVSVDGDYVRVNVWDFGGQEIMHATHQFFLTKRSVYVLVVDSRVDEQENRIEYWLKLVQGFGGDSPVLVVCNKADQHHLELARRRLVGKYPSILGFYETSCKTGAGIAALAAAIGAEIGKLSHVRDMLPFSWFDLKVELESMTKSFLPLIEFEALCNERGVAEADEQRTLLRLFHDLGTILSFQDDPRLQETNVLSPAWVTNGVYKILNWNHLFQAKGVLETRLLGSLLNPVEYPAKTHLFLIDMMRKFELCFPFPDASEGERYLVPALLPKDEPDTGAWDGALTFEYHYDILPDSVISRFLVRMHHCISKHTYWRFGAVLVKTGCRAFVRADTTDGVVEIRVTDGGPIARQLFLGEIRGQLDAIHAPFVGLKVAAKVVVFVDDKRVVMDYNDLLAHEDAGIDTIIAPGTRIPLGVREVLNGLRTPEQRGHLSSAAPEAEPLDADAPGLQSPWLSGSFYLFAFVMVIAASAAVAYALSWIAVPAVLVTGALGVSVVGAFQLRHDYRLKEKNFLDLMGETYRQLPFIRDGGARSSLGAAKPTAKRALPRAKRALPKAKRGEEKGLDGPEGTGASRKKSAKR